MPSTLKHVLHCAAYGVPFCIQTAHPAAAESCLPHSTTSLRVSAPETATFVLDAPTPAALEQLTRDLMIHVADGAPDRVFVHAGVVAVDGRGLMLPGPSFAGKTTLTAALVGAGATFYSDEYAVLDAAGLCHPYTRPLQMRRPGASLQTPTQPTELHPQAALGEAPLPVTHVVFTSYAAGGAWQPEPVSPGLAVLEMLRHSIAIQRSPARVMAALAALMRGATATSSPRGEAHTLTPVLLRALRGGTPLA